MACLAVFAVRFQSGAQQQTVKSGGKSRRPPSRIHKGQKMDNIEFSADQRRRDRERKHAKAHSSKFASQPATDSTGGGSKNEDGKGQSGACDHHLFMRKDGYVGFVRVVLVCLGSYGL